MKYEHSISGAFFLWDNKEKSLYNNIGEGVRSGTGKGEYSFASVLAVSEDNIQGPTENFDVLSSSGLKFEVKQPRYKEIASAVEGKGYTKVFVDIAHEIASLSDISDETWNIIDDYVEGDFDFNLVKSFIDTQICKIEKAELPKGRIIGRALGGRSIIRFGLYQVTKMLSIIKNMKSSEKIFVSINYKGTRVDVEVAAKIAEDIGLPISYFNLHLDEIDQIKKSLTHKVFDNPELILDMWAKTAPPSEVFGHCAAVVLVNEDGFSVIKKEDYDDFISFERITQGSAHFKIKNIPEFK